ncbi:hypothetical protein GCM10010492_55780 [Saccharothrix mutabilis subsp. mutabilis]|uniref:Uncharacterized protein n=1 Tax=Saccharothrix mutabilis subsp. mutabilis TaxID=66855 RepID=A0ABN0UFD7_9PSEU
MTAIPPADGTRSPLLICDDCGRAFAVEHPSPLEWLVLWTHAVEAGWRGRDRPVGPHVCERCAPTGAGRW